MANEAEENWDATESSEERVSGSLMVEWNLRFIILFLLLLLPSFSLFYLLLSIPLFLPASVVFHFLCPSVISFPLLLILLSFSYLCCFFLLLFFSPIFICPLLSFINDQKLTFLYGQNMRTPCPHTFGHIVPSALKWIVRKSFENYSFAKNQNVIYGQKYVDTSGHILKCSFVSFISGKSQSTTFNNNLENSVFPRGVCCRHHIRIPIMLWNCGSLIWFRHHNNLVRSWFWYLYYVS